MITTDELLLDEGLTPEALIQSGREWRELLLASMTPQERLAGVSSADIIQLIEGDEQIRKQIIAHTPPEERLAGLKPEELTALLAQIERHLGQHKP
jgi:hypothetical protein